MKHAWLHGVRHHLWLCTTGSGAAGMSASWKQTGVGSLPAAEVLHLPPTYLPQRQREREEEEDREMKKGKGDEEGKGK